MFFGNPQKGSNVSVSTAGVSKQAATVNTQSLLGPTASANVNLGGVQGGPAPYNQNQMGAGNQMSPQMQGGWNQAPQGNAGMGPTNMTPGQYGNQGNPTSSPYANPLNQNKPGSPSPMNQGNNYPNPTNSQFNNQQNSGLVQPISGPGPQNSNMPGQGPSSPGPFNQGGTQKPPMGPQDNKNSISTAQTSKNTSMAGPVGTQNKPPGSQVPIQKNNGVKQSEPSLAFTTNFKNACGTKHKPNTQDKVILPWDHSKQNYCYNDLAFDKIKHKISKDQVKSVAFCNF